jgi:hypothetical protein
VTVGHLEAFVAADADFYETPVRARFPAGTWGTLPALDLPSGWTSSIRGYWEVAEPPSGAPPETGWKVHVTACPETAVEVAEAVAAHCVAEQLPFKRLATIELVHLMTSKYAPRASSGKLFTIYPPDDSALVDVCQALHDRLAHLPGPRVLTDVQWRGGPVSVRYGALRGRPHVDADGTPGILMRSPDGTWVPDRRTLGGGLPEGVELPRGFALTQMDAGATPFEGFTRLSALHHSNSGGVYKAWQSDPGRWVVLKEARPLSGYDRTGRSGVERLRHEADVLRRLEGLEGVPRFHDYFAVQGHEFLVQEFLEGLSCYNWSGARNPLSGQSNPTLHAVRTYVRDVATVVDRLADLVSAVHARGIAIDDLHPGNVLVAEGNQVSLIDLEAATSLDDVTPTTFRVAGFGSQGRSGRERDQRALDMFALWLLLPLTRLVDLDPSLLADHVGWVRQAYAPPPELDVRLQQLLARAQQSDSPASALSGTVAGRSEPGFEDLLVLGLRHTATPERDDRLFPGSAEGFTFGGQSFAYGAAGILWSLHRCGTPPTAEEVEWLSERALRSTGFRGLYVGDAGLALAATALGVHPDVVRTIGRRLLAAAPESREANIGLYAGAAGDALGLLHLADALGEERYAERAVEWAEVCVRQREAGRELPRPGYLHGWTGVGQLFLELYRRYRDSRWLGHAVGALQQDLSRCSLDPLAGVRMVLPGVRRIGYLGQGSGGLALVADELLLEAEVPELEALVPGLSQACERTIVAQPGLFAGRAGMLAVVARLLPRLSSAEDPARFEQARAAVESHRRLLRMYAVRRGEGLLVPGDGGLRLSTDLFHGNAGLLLALSQLDGGDFLPFFTARPPVQRTGGSSTHPSSCGADGGNKTDKTQKGGRT